MNLVLIICYQFVRVTDVNFPSLQVCMIKSFDLYCQNCIYASSVLPSVFSFHLYIQYLLFEHLSFIFAKHLYFYILK